MAYSRGFEGDAIVQQRRARDNAQRRNATKRRRERSLQRRGSRRARVCAATYALLAK
jgi:hypothetical protein